MLPSMPLTGQEVRNFASCCQQELEVWVSILLLQMLSFCMTVTGEALAVSLSCICPFFPRLVWVVDAGGSYCRNPQVDLQAQDRAHRIGQKKEVQVFRFCTEVCI